MDCGRRWMTGDGSEETDHGRRMTINLICYMMLQSCNRTKNCRHTVFRRHGSTEYDTEYYLAIPNYGATWLSFIPEYDLGSDFNSASVIPSHRYNADTAQAVRDLSLAEQQSLKRRMTVQEWQQPHREQLPYQRCRNEAP
jgi:hypothetical protein